MPYLLNSRIHGIILTDSPTEEGDIVGFPFRATAAAMRAKRKLDPETASELNIRIPNTIST